MTNIQKQCHKIFEVSQPKSELLQKRKGDLDSLSNEEEPLEPETKCQKVEPLVFNPKII